MNTRSLVSKLSKKFPKKIAKKYHDYVGLMTGTLKEQTNIIVLCLDLDEVSLSEARKYNPDLIITHHPFIYGTKFKVFKRDLEKKKVCDEVDTLNIPVYSYHTNFDEGKDGMNDALAEKLGLSDIESLPTIAMARGGKLPKPMTFEDFNRYLIDTFKLNYSLPMNYGKNVIEKVAIIGGGGWNYYFDAKLDGYDCFVSGDIPHHGRRGVIANKCNYIDVAHEIENIFMEQMEKNLLEIDSSLEIIKIYHEVFPEIVK